PRCRYTSERRALMTRHIEAHQRPMNWVCAGVPLEDAGEHFVDPDELEVDDCNGRRRVGGCSALFREQRALLKHLQTTVNCVG
ncbi:uncharacterized protein BXZ73DRAFT_12921, partial [Epithele typhae]|uniref:uncharacterized protein n=1 Tax=Epithele typhae TaxID=378194 RepID=UPI002008D9EA